MNKNKMLMGCLIVLFTFGCTKQIKNKVTQVQVEQGLLQGKPGSDPSVMVYKGVPYAAPPVGELRWRAPQPPITWEGIRVADQYSANCTQFIHKTFGPWTSEYQPKGTACEDCLCLNIWTAAKSSKEKRPVMVYIPGGAFINGSGNVPVYNGENLAKKGLVVVTINYRVGVMGFFAHPELTQESGYNASGNYGLLDQVAALEWVKRNITAFGGDPDKVTIMGQSAGAMSVHCLTASPLCKGLFVRAIAQSSSFTRLGSGETLDSSEQRGIKYVKAKGVSSLAELRAMSAEAIMAPTTEEFRFSPLIDGWFLPKSIDEIFAASEQNDVVTLIGFVADEGSSRDNYGKATAEKFQERVNKMVPNDADKILTLYPISTESELMESQKALTRDMSMVSMSLWAQKREKTASTNVYTYLFTHQQPGDTQDKYLAFHSSELPYVFDNLNQSPRPWTSEDEKIAEIMSNYWVNFISTGDPNGKGLPKWPTFSEAPQETMELGDKMESRPITSKDKFEVLKELLQD